jgi:4-amino-4-deoxy-L-arabinose transferase-like glycosyltransferase
MTRSPKRSRLHVLVVLLLLLSGAVFRLYFVRAHSAFMQSDEAIVGLMTKHIISRGQFPIFAYGEERSGALVTYLVAPFFYLFGASNLVFKSVTIIVSLVFACLLYLLAKRIGDKRTGLFALALSVFGPALLIMWSVHAAAEYLLAMVCGVSALLLCDEILFAGQLRSVKGPLARRHVTYGSLGLVMGIGFWVSPLIVSFIGAAWIVLFLRDRKCFFRPTFLVFFLFFVVGNLPGLLFNALPELRSAAGLLGAPNWISYTSLFTASAEPLWSKIFGLPRALLGVARVSLPVLVGGSLWEYETGLLRRSMAVVMMGFWLTAVLYTLGARVRLWMGQEGRRRWTLTSVDAPILQFFLTFLIFAVSQYRWLAREPRYLLPVFAFLPIAGACFLSWLHSRQKAWAYSVLSLVLLFNLTSSIWFSQSLDPDHGLWPKDEALIRYLIDHEIRHPVANYWIAYAITFESDEQVIPVPIGYSKFTMYGDVLDNSAPTHYIFRKRERDDRDFAFFSYGLVGPQWTAQDFADYLQETGVPQQVYQVQEFEHYALYHVPREYLDSARISSADALLPEDYYLETSQYLASVIRPGDALLLNPSEQAVPLGRHETGGIEVYLVPEQTPLDEEMAGESLARLASDYRRLFVLFGDTSDNDPGGVVENWLNRYAYRADDRWFGNLRLVLYGTPALPPAELPSRIWEAHFGDSIELAGTDLPIEHVHPGDVVPLTLFWRTWQPIEQNLKVFVHLLSAEGQLAGQHDGEPGGGLHPTSTWRLGESIVDRHGVLLPDDLPAGEYQLVIGMYDPATGSRLPVAAKTDTPWGGFLPVGTVHVGP